MFGVYKYVKNYKVLTYIIPMKAGDFRVPEELEAVSNYVREISQAEWQFKYFAWDNESYGIPSQMPVTY